MTDNLPSTLSGPSVPTIVATGGRITADDLLASYEEEEKSLASTGEVKKEEEAVTNYPTIKGTFKDTEVSIPEEALFSVKIGKKTVPVKFKTILSSYTTKEEFDREMDRRVGQVRAKEKAHEEKISQMNSKISRAVQLAMEGHPEQALGALCALAAEGTTKDPAEMLAATLDELSKTIQVWARGTPEQKALWLSERKRENAERKIKELSTTQQLTVEQQALLAEVDAVCSELQITREEFVGVRKDLIKNHVGEGRALSSEDEASPSVVKDYFYRVVHEHKVIEAIKEVAQDKASDEAFIDLVFSETFPHHKDLSKEDIADVVKTVVVGDSQAVENLNRKVQKAAKAGYGSQSVEANSDEKKTDEDDELEEFFFGKSKRVFRR